MKNFKTLKISIITTLKHNVGDDFVREGILYLLEKKIGNYKVSFIHKHIPITVRPEFEWIYICGLTKLLDKIHKFSGLLLSKVLDALPLNKKSDKILNCNLLVQSGAPVYWCFPNGGGSHNNEWYSPLICRRYSKVKKRVVFINLGAGTCQHFYSNGTEFIKNNSCASFIRELHSLTSVTTVRDTLSKKILNNLGMNAPVIPCPSIFARERLNILPDKTKYIALNFMTLGGHYGLWQQIDIRKWENTFKAFYNKIRDKFPVVLVCHDKKEVMAAKKILPEADLFFAKSAKNYLEFYSRAKFFMGCRVHGAYATASFGRPAFIIGTDTRARMAEEISLNYAFVNDVDSHYLEEIYHNLEKQCDSYPDQFIAIRKKALNNYLNTLKPHLENIAKVI
jgi:polysaccharide pyruvyl transferase WcaK-like protein